MMNSDWWTQAIRHVCYIGIGLLSLLTTNCSPSSVWTMPWPVVGFRSYKNLVPIRYDAPAGLAWLNFTFTGLKTKSSCPDKDIHIVLRNGGLPLVDLSENSLPEHFLPPETPSIKLVIRPGHMAEVSLTRPPPGPYFIVGYLKAEETTIKQMGLHAEETCFHLFMSRAKFSESVEATDISPGNEHTADIDTAGSFFRFIVPPTTLNFEVQVVRCEPSPCNLSVKHVNFSPKDSSEVTGDCSGSEASSNVTAACVLRVSSPALQQVHLIQIKSVANVTNRTVGFIVLTQECPPLRLGSTQAVCARSPPLDRIQYPLPLTTRFGLVHNVSASLMADLTAARISVVPFSLVEPNDVGGTLKWQMRLIVPQGQTNKIQVCGGLMYRKLPDASLRQLNLCTADIPGRVNINSSLQHGGNSHLTQEIKRYVAYPAAGQWHIVLQTHCLDQNGTTTIACEGPVLVEMKLEIQACVDGGCSSHGTCESSTVGTNLISFSACQCDADYRGYGCSDSRHAQSVPVQLASAYLLTLSNLFFLPAIVLGLRRGFIAEAFVYFFNMFFSTFYHACDGTRLQRYRMCIADYDLLQLADFFASACSLWFTLVAMARVRHLTGLLQIVGVFPLFLLVVYDKTSLTVIAVPIFTGLAVIICSWGVKMYRKKRVYPSSHRYVFYLAPGVLLAGIGGVCFAFLETESNYKYLHSLWHMCIALSIVLLLPPRPECRQNYVNICCALRVVVNGLFRCHSYPQYISLKKSLDIHDTMRP